MLLGQASGRNENWAKCSATPLRKVSPFQLSDFLCLGDVPSLVLKTRLKFIGQKPASEKPVQSLATLLAATNSDPTRSMPQFDSRPPKETLLDVCFRTAKADQPLA